MVTLAYRKWMTWSGVAALAFACLVAPLLAEQKQPAKLDVATIMAKLNARYKEIADYSATFEQRVASDVFKNRVPVWSGEVFFRRDKGFLWKYKEPEKKDIGSDSRLLWFTNFGEKQIVISNLSENVAFNSGLAFLWGVGKVENFLECPGGIESSDGKVVILKCLQKGKKKYFKAVELGVSKEDSLVTKTVVADFFDTVIEITFSNVKINSSPPESLFQFQKIKGFRIVQGAELIK